MLNILECKHCHAPLPEDQLANNDGVVVCEYCSTVHRMDKQPVSYYDKPKREKMKREKPDKFKMNRIADGIEINYRWLGKQHTGLLFFALIWNGFIAFFTILMIGGGLESNGGGAFSMIFFMIPFYAVGIGIAWYVLAGFLNQTHIRIRQNGIDTAHDPIPMFGTKNLSVGRRDIEQVYCRRRVAYTSNDVPVYVFDVHYVKKGGDDVELIKGFDSINKAIFIEQQIEKLYKIGDMPIDGEYQSVYG